ncbi:aminomethyl transferase family protein [Streptomyces sp. 3MP-14]|uniref:Aminomethyl transferase family protein n=1 Tax=Streptomyces mimosae TaxID=2586635 RepID=A0A5N6A0Y4_9ACTN|nr:MULTISPECIES: aminomethyltransferase family protein [Streptomyces]KAB8161723.1 aminomethyl transferase family protein [Streptomyces mimosae]KAB8175009.1 aminomethyl transferase family protein [Streptomyces sp. 3MP-14]
MTPNPSTALALRPWDLGPRFDLGPAIPFPADGWAWRTLPPEHPAILARPRALRRNDPGDALGAIAERYGEPESYCVLGGNVASVSTWRGTPFTDQYAALTEGTGAFPCGGMYYFSVAGPHAADLLNLLTPRSVDLLEVGQASFVIFTTPEGTVDTEGVVLRVADETFHLSVGGDTRPPTWLHDAIERFPDTRVEEADLSSFNLKGPRRLAAMTELLADEFAGPLARLGRFRGLPVRTRGGADAWVVRTVIGVELWGSAEVMNEAWRAMVARPERYTPCGWDVLATYRLECPEFAFYLCPLDIHRGTYLLDVGLEHVVSRRKQPPYVGWEALQKPAQFGGRMWMAGLEADSPEAPRRSVGERVSGIDAEAPTGYVTSAGYSPKAGRELCFAHLPVEIPASGTVRFEDGTTWRALPLPILAERTTG